MHVTIYRVHITMSNSKCLLGSSFSNHDLLLSTAEVDLYRMKILRQKLPSVLKALQELHGDPEKLKLGT